MIQRTLTSALLASALFPSLCPAQSVQVPFNVDYTLVDLGPPPGVPGSLGGLVVDPANPNVLLIGGNANSSTGNLYAVPLTRNAQGNITGFAGPATVVSTCPNNDGGMFLQNGVVLFTRYSTNALGQIAPGSAAMTKSIALGPLGVASSVGAMNIVPAGYPAAGRVKLASYNTGSFYDTSLIPDGTGTFDLGPVTQTGLVPGGPEGIVYPPVGSPQLLNYNHVVICEYGGGQVVVYDIDNNADPIPGTARTFISGLSGAEGANIDPVSNDFLFSTFGGGNRVIAVRGFGGCGTFAAYGTGTPGTGGVIPSIVGTGCPLTGNPIQVTVTGARPNTLGTLNIGDVQLGIPIYNIVQLTNPLIPVAHFSDAMGSYVFTENIPNTGAYAGFTFYFQAGYLDPGAQIGISATAGVQMDIR